MKKLILILALLMLLTSCGVAPDQELPDESLPSSQTTEFEIPPHPLDDPDMPPEMADEVRKGYLKIKIVNLLLNQADKVYIAEYLGEYSGNIVVIMGYEDEDRQTIDANTMTYETVAGYTINFPMNQRPVVYRGGCFYSLHYLYEMDCLAQLAVYQVGCKVDPTFIERYPTPPY